MPPPGNPAPKVTTVRPTTTRPPTPTSRPVKKAGVLSRIRPMGFEDTTKINVLLYGQSGTGKTTVAASFPGKLLWVVCSGTDKADELRSVDTPKNRERIDEVVLGLKDEDGNHTPAEQEFEQVLDHLRDNADKYKTVVLDHVTGFADLVLRDVLGLTEMPQQKSFGMATREQYGIQSAAVKSCLHKLLNLPQTVVVLAQERVFNSKEDEDGMNTEGIQATVGAALGPSTVGWLYTAVSYIARTYIRPKVVTKKVKIGGSEKEVKTQTDESEYCLRVGPSGVYRTKFRIPGGVQADNIINPNYSKIMALVRGEKAS